MNLFTPPFHFEPVETADNDTEHAVLDAEDALVAYCLTDLHAAELCERLNAPVLDVSHAIHHAIHFDTATRTKTYRVNISGPVLSES